MKPHNLAAVDIPDTLRSAIDYKAGQREGMGVTTYKMLKNTLQHKTVGGQAAVSIEAEFERVNAKMIEYNTWAVSEKTHVYVRARVLAEDFSSVQGQINQILETFNIP
jgi:hypothetical protein